MRETFPDKAVWMTMTKWKLFSLLGSPGQPEMCVTLEDGTPAYGTIKAVRRADRSGKVFIVSLEMDMRWEGRELTVRVDTTD